MGESQVNMINLNEIFQDVKSDLIGQLLNESKDSKNMHVVSHVCIGWNAR